MAYLATGFTPDEEKEILETNREVRTTARDLQKGVEEQRQVRAFTIAAAVIGALYSLAKLGELTSEMRAKRRERSA